MSKQKIEPLYKLIPMSEITDEARRIAVLWGDEYFPGIALSEKHKLASDIMNYTTLRAQPLLDALEDLYNSVNKGYLPLTLHQEQKIEKALKNYKTTT